MVPVSVLGKASPSDTTNTRREKNVLIHAAAFLLLLRSFHPGIIPGSIY